MTAYDQPSVDTGATLRDYVRIARFDHVSKHVFIVPGVFLALLLRGLMVDQLVFNILAGFVAAVAIASANYVINEWLDREFDRFHPEKSQRAAVQKELSGRVVVVEWLVLLVVGLSLAALVNPTFLAVAVLFAISGVTYNVEPIRTKDKVFLDVLSESLNNPLRLMLGWAMVDPFSLPPASLLLAFWFGGAFLMNAKRLAEYRDIVASVGAETLGRYRRSFRFYTEQKLSIANLVYALLCAFFMAIFLIKYRIEYILVFPCVIALFGIYYSLTLTPDSVARKPEKLYKARPLIGMSVAAVLVFAFATFVDIPILGALADQHYILLYTLPAP